MLSVSRERPKIVYLCMLDKYKTPLPERANMKQSKSTRYAHFRNYD
jgi:hypothetical protein